MGRKHRDFLSGMGGASQGKPPSVSLCERCHLRQGPSDGGTWPPTSLPGPDGSEGSTGGVHRCSGLPEPCED